MEEEKTILPGYSAAVEEDGGSGVYDEIAAAVEAHNNAAQPGEPYWGIAIANSTYTVYEYGEVPQPPTEDEKKELLRSEKLRAMSEACEKTIYNGMDVLFGDGTQEHFSLDDADQNNIDGIFSAVTLGATAYPYHADGQSCRMYSAKDIVTLYVSKQSFITKQTTYHNALKQWIERETSYAVLEGISYGVELPEDLAKGVQAILTEANEQAQAIVAKLTGSAG